MRHFSQRFLPKSFIYIILAALMASCATQQKTPGVTTTEKQVEQELVSDQDVISAQQYLSQAKQLQGSQALDVLVKASDRYLQEQSFHKALWLANQLSPLVQDSSLLYRLTLIKASSLFALEQTELAQQQLELANTMSEESSLAHSLEYFQLLAGVQKARNLTLAAIDAQLRAFAMNPFADNDDVLLLWQSLSQLSQWQIKQLSNMAPPHFKGWRQLLGYVNKFGANMEQVNRYLKQWQRNHPTHPGQLIADSLLNEQPEEYKPVHNIAVILPLSGNQAVAGEAAQQGVLAAYQNAQEKTLHFIDANRLDWDGLQDIIEQEAIDYVIGPLLKPNVEAFIQQGLAVPALLLNLPENGFLAPHHSALSMRPEDEAVQAATMLSSKDYRHPMVLSTQDRVSKRIAASFVEQWQLITGQTPEIVYFSQENKMQNELKASLDVDLSQQRIKDLDWRIKQTLKTESRNRRDIDMIYLVGSPKDSRLLKPYIDVNISPFAEVIPIYASSRSHSAQVDASDSRDLTGLVFTEIPWLLSSQQQNKALVQMTQKMWPQRSESLQKIFAMGYDSLALVEKIPTMQKKPYVHHFGQTGTLRLDENQVLTRSLLWGRYRRDRVQEIALD